MVKICVLILTTPYLLILSGVDSDTLVKYFLGETKVKTLVNMLRHLSLFVFINIREGVEGDLPELSEASDERCDVNGFADFPYPKFPDLL